MGFNFRFFLWGGGGGRKIFKKVVDGPGKSARVSRAACCGCLICKRAADISLKGVGSPPALFSLTGKKCRGLFVLFFCFLKWSAPGGADGANERMTLEFWTGLRSSVGRARPW